MKILIVTPYFMEPRRWVASGFKAAFALARSGREVVVLTSGSAGSPRTEVPAPGLKVYRFRDFFIPDPVNFGILPFLSYRLWSVLRAERPTHVLVYKHMFYTSLSVAWLKLLGRSVVLVTDTFPGIVWFSRSSIVNAVLWIYARTIGLGLLRLADRVVLLHPGLLPTARKLGLDRVEIVPNGVDLAPIREARPPEDIAAFGGVLVTYIGRLESVKGIELLLDVARELCGRRSDVRFLIVGDTAGAAELTSRYRDERIRFLGYRTDVPAILSASDVFVLPSYAEGLPNALLEAMAAGCACVASRVGAVPELAGDDEAALTVPPGDRGALLAAIERLLGDPDLRARLGERARRVIEEGYRLDDTAERLVSVLEGAAGEASA
jgi:glycosyltransferase involved in cell wall biosynthesis